MAGQAKQLGCAGMDDLLKLLEENKDASNIYILFCGETNDTGESWCPDCVKAEPVVEKSVQKITDPKVVFILCSVGDRATWKDPQNAFRTHPKFKLTSIPTLIKYNTPQRLGDSECSKEEMVEMVFED